MAKIHLNSNQTTLSFTDNTQNTNFIENERWIPLLNFEELYEISDFGRIRKGSKFIKIGNKRGAAIAKIGKKNSSIRLSISKAVFIAFGDKTNIPELYIVKHQDKNRFNNHYLNLYFKKISSISSKLNMLNHTFWDLTVTKPLPDGTWECECRCGNKRILNTQHIRNKSIKNCGQNCFYVDKKPALQQYQIIYKSYIAAAKKRGLSFELTKEEFRSIITKNCFYCGDKPIYKRDYISQNNDIKYVGVDRVNSDKGYSVSNCVPCCKFCNYAKSDFELKDWIEWIYKISYQKDKIKKFSENTSLP